MKGKVKCTCGWSWNKSDSSAKDMYICHECGRDNSNNMKNGGWLENYNDSQASAPEGMVGDGFSNVGRNYSPAWGGQFQMGGNVYPVNYVPQAQNGKNKKKKGVQDLLRDTEDSVNKSLGYPMGKAHTAAEELAALEAPWYNPKTKQWEINDPIDNFRHPMAGRYASEAIQDKLYNIPVVSQIAGMVGSNALGVAHELSTLFHPKDKRGWYDKIRESGEDIFNNAVGATVGSLPISDERKTNILTKLSNQNMLPDGVSGKGGDMYIKHAMGGFIPKAQEGETMFKTPSIPQADYVQPTYSYPKREPYSSELEFLKTRPNVGGMATEDNHVIINPYSPLSDEEKQGIIINETARLAMRNGYKRPTFELTPEQKEFFNTIDNGKPYSTDEQDIRETIIGRILSGDTSAGNVTPEQKKYAEELQKVLKFQMGGSLPGATGNMYARIGAPSNGPYAKKTMASAQGGKKIKIKDERLEGKVVKDNTNTKLTIKEKPITKELKKIGDDQKKIEDAKAYYKKYLNSPKARERITNMMDDPSGSQYAYLYDDDEVNPVDQEIKNRLAGLNKLQGKFEYANDFGTDSSSYYDTKKNSVFIRPNSDINIGYYNDPEYTPYRMDVDNAIGHEIGHGIAAASNKDSNNFWFSNGISKKESDMLMRANMGIINAKNREEILKSKENPEFKYDLEHDNRPSELKADIDALRYQLYRQGIYDAGTQDFTREHLEKAKPSFTKSRLNEHFTDDELIDLMNKLSYNENNSDGITPIAQNGKKFKLKDERGLVMKPSESTGVKRKDFNLTQSKDNKAYINAVARQKAEQQAYDKSEIARKRLMTPKQIEHDDYVRSATETVTQSVPETTWERTKAIVSNPMTAIGYKVRGENLPGRFQYGPRNEHDYAVDWINPLQSLAALSNIPGQLGRGEFLDAGLSALDAVDLGIMSKGLKKVGSNQLRNLSPSMGYRDGGEIEEYPEAQLGRLIKKGIKAVGNDAKLVKKAIKTSAKDYGNLLKDLPKAKSVKEAVGRVAGLPIEGTLPRLSPEELKIFRQVQEIGRMRATGKSISKQYKYALEQGLPEEHLKKAFGKTKAEIENAISNPSTTSINLQRPPRTTSHSDAAIDQMNASAAAPVGSDQDIQNVRAMFDHLRIQPIISEPPILRGLSTQDLGYSIPPSGQFSKSQNFVEQAIAPIRNTSNAASNRLMNMVQDYPYHIGPVQQNVPLLTLSGSGSLKNVSNEVATKGTRGIQSGDVYTGSLSTSHSSYLPQLKQVFKSTEGAPQFFGYHKMNTMGFLSNYNYSSDDIAKYLNTEIDEQIKRGIIPNNIQRPYVKGDDVFLPHYGIKQFREGGIIDSDRGQWDYPGEITRINSNEITMGPDPKTGKPLTKPLLGISDTGDVKLMRPGGNYKFDGKRVTEYPIAQGGLTMGTTSTENDVRESSAQSAKANAEAKKEAKLLAAKLLAEQEENRRNLFARDIKVRQPDGEIKIVNTGSPEYEEMYKAGNIQSADAGEGDSPYFGGQLPELVLQQEMTPLLQAKKDYGYLSNKEAFINRKKDEYLKSLGNKNNWFGANRADFPERVLRAIVGQYEYEKNNYAAEQLAKQRGFNLDDRGDWVDELTPAERESISNSEYSGQLNPNEFAEMASGVQQLANTLVPGQPWNIDIPGLTQRELEEDRESWMSPLKVFAPFNIPGNLVANYLKNSEDYVDNPFLGTQRMGNVDVWDSMALNPLNLSMITAGSNAVSKIPTAGRAIARGTKSLARGTKSFIENAPAAMSFAADAVKDVRGVVKQYKEISKIKNQDDYYNSVVNTSKYIDDLPQTGIGASSGVTDANELYNLMTTLSGNFKSYLKRMGGEEFAKTEADNWKQSFVNTDLAKRMEDAIDKNLPLSPEVYKQLAIDFSNTFPKGKSLIAPAKKELAKIQKNITFNKEKDYETLKEFAKNLKIKIPKRPDKVEYSPKERETIDAIRELGKYKSVANYRKDQLLSDPEAMANINKLILKLDDDVIENILKIKKSELLNRYKNIIPDLKKTQVDITSNPIPNADLWLVNEQNLLQPGVADDIHILNEKRLLAPELKHQTLTDRIGQSYARNFEPVNYEKPSSYPQDLIFMAKTDYQYRNAKDAAGNYLFDAYNNPIEKLVPEGNVKQQLIGAVKKVKASPKGSNFVGSHNLSSDSYPLTLDAGIMMSEQGLVDVGVETGAMYLNDMGYTHSSPGLVIKDINSKIEQLEKLSGKKLPRAKYDPKADRYRMYKVPKIYFTRLKQGGSINKADENSLVKLDQLTNFTNYNKPQPGGWLSKYE